MSKDLAYPPTRSCPDLEQLKAWVDRELEAAAEAPVAAHVENCAHCQEEVTIMRKLGVSLQELDSLVEPPAQLRERILARTGGPAGAHGPSRWSVGNPFALIRWAMAAAVAVIVGFVGVNSLPGRPVSTTSKGSTQPAQGLTSLPASPSGQSNDKFSPPEMPGAGAAMGGGAPVATRLARSGEFLPPAGSVNGKVDSGQQLRAGSEVPGASLASPDDVNVYARGASVDDVTRKVVQTAVLSVRTRSALEGIQKEIEKRLKKDAGYVESANLSTPEGGERTAIMRLRVPVEKLDDYVAWLASLGEVRAKNVRGDDVTGTWIDQRAEVRELRKEEARLLKVYNTDRDKARRNEARWQLLRIRPRIASSEERFALTTKLATLSTVELTLIEPAQARIQGNLWQDIDGTTRSAVSAFMVALR
ncbi:MAG: hypothetical protein K0Q72_4102, partial [Armatimonadetes bacterium]|nr:hypothetical protein [Armatimonadota bacterium]